MNTTNDEGAPEVKIFFQPDDMDVCSFGMVFDWDEGGEEKAAECFRELTEEMVAPIVAKMKRELGGGK